MSLHMLSKCGCQGRLGHWGAISTALVCSSLISVRSEIAVCEVGSSRHMCQSLCTRPEGSGICEYRLAVLPASRSIIG